MRILEKTAVQLLSAAQGMGHVGCIHGNAQGTAGLAALPSTASLATLTFQLGNANCREHQAVSCRYLEYTRRVFAVLGGMGEGGGFLPFYAASAAGGTEAVRRR